MQDFAENTMAELAAIIASHLEQHNIHVVLVGGLAVSLYTENRYLTSDIDMVDVSYQKPATLQAAMAEIGFYKHGRIYRNDTTNIVVEFPSAPLSVGDEPITEQTVVSTRYGDIPVLYAADIVKDRLAAYFHWQDQQALVQALCVMLCHQITPKEIKTFSEKEAGSYQYTQINDCYETLKKAGIKEMEDIEEFIVSERLK